MTEHISIRVDSKTYHALKQLAKDGYRPIAAEIRRLVDEEIERRAVMEPELAALAK